MIKKTLALGAVTLMPVVTFAQINTGSNLGDTVTNVINFVVPIIFTVALAFFFWNLAQFFFGGEDKKKEAKGGIVVGFAILFLMVSIGGIVALLQDTVTFGDTSIEVPQLNNSGNNVNF